MRLDGYGLFVKDMGAMIRFYRDALGFESKENENADNVYLVKDGTLCLPGEGCFDFDALMEALAEIGYDGPVIMEPYLKLIKSDEALLRSIAFMRDKMKE